MCAWGGGGGGGGAVKDVASCIVGLHMYELVLCVCTCVHVHKNSQGPSNCLNGR